MPLYMRLVSAHIKNLLSNSDKYFPAIPTLTTHTIQSFIRIDGFVYSQKRNASPYKHSLDFIVIVILNLAIELNVLRTNPRVSNKLRICFCTRPRIFNLLG